MRKSTRLNDMMIFLNDKSYFNLKDIMQEYGISKSTAIRDIQSLEEIGMPIFSETGRNGRYGILKNRLLSPIIFTVDEMYALYFAMLTLNAYESTPFHLSIEKLKKKFETCLSDELIKTINKMEHTLSLEGTKHYNSSPLLKDILEMCRLPRYLTKPRQRRSEWDMAGSDGISRVSTVFRGKSLLTNKMRII